VGAERGAAERGEPPGEHGAARGGARRPPGIGGAAAEGRSLGRHQEQEAEDAAGLRLRAGRQGDGTHTYTHTHTRVLASGPNERN